MYIRDLLLVEDQRFDFAGNRGAIISLVKVIQNNGTINWQHNPFYELIVGSGRAGDAESRGLSKEFSSQWRSYFSSVPFNSDGGSSPWSQMDINPEFVRKSGSDRTYNYYITVSKDVKNVQVFYLNYYKLASYLKPVSDQNQSPISYKTHRLLDNFIGHNDSLKVYYYDADLKGAVVDAVNRWLQDSGIKTGSRTHQHGVDIKGSGGGSFGQILSQKITKQFVDLVRKHGDQYSPEQYYQWVVQNLEGMIKRIQPEYK